MKRIRAPPATSWSANLLQLHAKSTTDLLADEAVDSFEPTFIVKADAPLQTFDTLFEIKVVESAKVHHALLITLTHTHTHTHTCPACGAAGQGAPRPLLRA